MPTNRKPKSHWAKRLGRRIADVQRSSRLTQEAFAAECHVSKATVSRWLHGIAVPAGDSLAAIAERFGVSLDWLLDGIGPDGEPCAEPVYRGQSRTKPELEQDVRAAVLARIDPGARPFVSAAELDVSALFDAARDELRDYASKLVGLVDKLGGASADRAVLGQAISQAWVAGVPDEQLAALQRVRFTIGEVRTALAESLPKWSFVAPPERFHQLPEAVLDAINEREHEAIRARLRSLGKGAPTMQVGTDGWISFAYPNRFGGPEPEPGRGVEQAAPIV